jgi:CBS domain-containing protein
MTIMKQFKITSLIVVGDDRKPLGVIHMHDILRVGIV